MAEKLEFDISVKNNDLQKALEKASASANTLSSYFAGGQKPVQDLTKEIEKASKATSFATDFMDQFRTQALGVAAGQAAFMALNSAIQFVTSSISESIAAYSESEDTVNKLAQALRVTGSYSQSSSDDIRNFASSLQKTTKYGDEAIISQFNFAKSLGLSNEQAKSLTTAAINLSATLGGSLEENTSKLGMTFSGTVGRLSRLIPELKSLTAEQLKNGEAIDIINAKYGGAGQNELNTYSGKVANLKNTFNDLQEVVGKMIVTDSTFVGVLNFLKKSLDDTNESIKTNEILSKYTADGHAKAGATASQLANDYEGLRSRTNKLNEEISRLIELGKQQGNADLYIQSIGALKSELKAIEDVNKGIEENLIYRKKAAQEAPDVGLKPEKTEQEKQALAKRNAEILSLTQQAELEKQNFLKQSEDLKINNELLSQSAEIERLNNFNAQKAEIEANSKMAQAQASLTGDDLKLEIQKINAEKELALIKSNDDKKIALQKLNIKARQDGEKAWTDYEKKQAQERELAQKDSLARIATLASEGNKTLAAIGKAAALTQIAIDGPAAVVNAYKNIPAPLNIPAAAAVAAAVAVQAGKVAGVKFEDGGFVGAQSGASVGPDNRIAQVRDGEMILNASQQRNLLNMINSGSAGGDIIVQVDGREIARAVRNQVQSGFRLA